MNIPNEAVEAATQAIGEEAHTRDFRAMAEAALEAAAPHLLKDMRPMTSIEIAARERPEQIEAARAKLRADRRETLVETVRLARAAAWEEGILAKFEAELLGRPLPKNPHRRDKPVSMEEQAGVDREAARAAMEADLNKHFPLLEDHLDDGYEVTCDATGCDFATGVGYYGAIMSKWNGHIADILSISGSPA